MQASRPACALVCAGLLCVTTACLDSIQASMAALFLGLAMLARSHPPLASLGPLFATVNFFILCMWLITPWTTPGHALLRIGPLAVTAQGLRLCLLITIKANAMLAIFRALLWPYSLAGLARGLSSLRCPAKLLWIFILLERNVSLLRMEYAKITDAAKLRGFAPRTDMRSYRTMGAMLAQLFIAAHDRGQRLHEALLLRGFDGQIRFGGAGGFAAADFARISAAFLASCALAAANVLLP